MALEMLTLENNEAVAKKMLKEIAGQGRSDALRELGLLHYKRQEFDQARENFLKASLDKDPQPSMAFLAAEVLSRISETLAILKPRFLIVLGDRYETFAAAAAAHLTGIEVVHLHGGETTDGAIEASPVKSHEEIRPNIA